MSVRLSREREKRVGGIKRGDGPLSMNSRTILIAQKAK